MNAMSLESKTQVFWDLSLSFNNKSSKNIPFEQAIHITEDLLDHTDPNRPLARQLHILEHEMIEGAAYPRSPTEIAYLNAYKSA